MKRLLRLAFLLSVSSALFAQAPTATRAELEPALGFEGPLNGSMPGSWGAFPADAVSADEKVVHSGKYSARVESDKTSEGGFATVKKSLPIDFTGQTIELRGYLKTESVGSFAGLWLREDGESGIVAFDNMQLRQIKGDTDWTQYTIVLPLDPEARMLYFGALVTGSGRIWADDLQLLVDGKPIWDAPKAKPQQTVLETDREFDAGSKIAVTELSKAQIDNLATLGKVWGFLKYHHPTITSGARHWDYELFRVLPQVLAAHDRQAANFAMLQWIEKLGPVSACNPCAKLDKSKLYFAPDLDWLFDTSRLGPELSRALQNIYEHRSTRKQFYISLKPVVENPSFDHELAYANLKLPDFGYQLLALYRFWNAVQYWSPNRDIIGEDWDAVLAQSIPTVSLAKDAAAYKLSLFALIARFHDGHANLWNAVKARPPYGDCRLPVTIRFIEDRAVTTAVLVDDENGLKVGDILSALDGVPVAQLVKQWKPYYSGSNDAAIMRDIARELSRGACEPAKLTVVRDEREMPLTITRIRPAETKFAYPSHDQPGPTFRLLSKDIAYLKLSSVKSSDAVHYIEQAAGTKGLIIDIRNYPSEFMVFDLGSRLVSKDTPFATFTVADLENPGAMRWGITESIKPAEPHYSGKVIVLVDETSISQAEYTAMAFRAAGALVVGSTTAGADGNVSAIPLPGGLQTMMSGIGVFYPDKKPTQRVGIIPDVQAQPTIGGIAAGRDEVLEVAIRQIVGSNLSENEIQQLAKPR